MNDIPDSRKVVFTIHDMIAEKQHPDSGAEKRKLAQRTDKIIAVSQTTKNDAVKIWGIAADKIQVIHHGSSLNPCMEYRTPAAPAPCNKHRMYFCHQSAFVRTELLRKYPFDEKYRMSADFKFFKQCYYRQCRFVHLNFPVAVFDTTGVSNTNRIAGIRENIAVIRETDRGWKKFLFMFRLYYTVGWLKIRGKK